MAVKFLSVSLGIRERQGGSAAKNSFCFGRLAGQHLTFIM